MDGGRKRRVRALNSVERLWVIEAVRWRDIKRELRRRSRIWIGIVMSGAGAALGFVQWGADLGEALRHILNAFGHG